MVKVTLHNFYLGDHRDIWFVFFEDFCNWYKSMEPDAHVAFKIT